MSSSNHCAHALCPYDLLQEAKKETHCFLLLSAFKNTVPLTTEKASQKENDEDKDEVFSPRKGYA